MTRKEIKNLDTLWSLAVKEVGKFRCEACGRSNKVTRLNSCHIIGRRNRSTRWGAMIDGQYDLCGWCGCYNDHKQYDEHGPKEAFIREKVIGSERYERVRQKAQEIAKDQDYEEIRKQLQKVIDSCKTKNSKFV
jgi:hypothetical protein